MDHAGPDEAVTEVLVNLAHVAESVVELYDPMEPSRGRVVAHLDALVDEITERLNLMDEMAADPAEDRSRRLARASAAAAERGWRETAEALDRVRASLGRFERTG